MASLKEQHRDEIVDLESKHSSAFDGKECFTFKCYCGLLWF